MILKLKVENPRERKIGILMMMNLIKVHSYLLISETQKADQNWYAEEKCIVACLCLFDTNKWCSSFVQDTQYYVFGFLGANTAILLICL